MTRLLALDQSIHGCGWALLDQSQGTLDSGSWALSDGIANRAAAFVQLHRNLEALHKDGPLDVVVCEAPILMRKDKVDKLVALYGLVAHLESWARARNVRCLDPVSVATWRNTFLGKGYAKDGDRKRDTEELKILALRKCRTLGFDPATHDQAEAIGIVDHAAHKLKLQPFWRVDTL